MTDRVEATSRRVGFTMIELTVAMGLMGIVMLAVGSVMVLATRTLQVSTGGSALNAEETARVLETLNSDLRVALRFTTPLLSDRVECTVPDVDGDGEIETVRWTWSGSPAYALTRELDLSNDNQPPVPVVVATDVREFDLSYVTRTWGPPPAPDYVESDEALLVHHDDTPDVTNPRVVFVVTNASSPTYQELTREGLMAWWGYAVTRLDSDADQGAYDDAVTSADVVYVSEDVESADVERKLRDVAVGVVCEEINLADDLGFATSFSFPPAANLLTVDVPTHPVSSALGPTPVTIADTPQAVTQLASVAGERSPDLLALARWDAAPALALLEAGDRLTGASGSPGRLGYDTVFAQQTGKSDHDKEHVATRVTLDRGAVVTSLSAYLMLDGDKKMRFGIYTDADGEPGTLLAETAWTQQDEATAWFTLALPEPLPIPVGTYWLAAVAERDVIYHYELTGGETRFAAVDGDDGLMPVWHDTYGPDPNERRLSLYANWTPMDFAAGRRVMMPWGGNAFDIDSLTEAGQTLMRNAIAWAADTSPGDFSVPYAVTKLQWPAACFLPELPINATGWSITRIMIAIRADPADLGGKVRFELRYADHDGTPGEVLQQTSELPVNAWPTDAFTWIEVPFTPQQDLNPDAPVCLVVRGRNNENAFVKVDRSSGTSLGVYLVETSDQGATWSLAPGSDDVRLYLYGRFTTSGTPQWP